MQQLVNHRWFALADLILVFTYGAAVTIFPQLASWLIVILLVPWLVRLVSGKFTIRKTAFYYPLLLIVVTAGIGVWAAYDPSAAWEKFWIISGSVIIFATLINQPEANLGVVASLVGLLGVIIAIIFLLDNDWTIQSSDFGVIERAGDWIMAHRGSIDVIPIRPNFAGGLLAILLPITAAYAIHNLRIEDKTKALITIAIGMGMILSLFLTSSRGAWIALILGLGGWLLWHASLYLSSLTNRGLLVIVTLLLSLILIPTIFLIATNPGGVIGLSALLPGLPSGESRLDLALNTTKIIGDYPFTGGGLQSFPGLYSQYIMVTPYFSFSYSHNFYLDVILEQGLAGGLAILGVIFGGALVAIRQYRHEGKGSLYALLSEAVVVSTFIVLIHGLVDDPLYGESGTPLLLLLPGIALMLANKDHLQITSVDRDENGGRSSKFNRFRENRFILPGTILIILFALVLGFRKSLIARWYANLGAVEMSRTELQNWPQNKWNENPDVSSLARSGDLFTDSLEISHNQRTSWHRLGLISMQRRDFNAAQTELGNAFVIDPDHRGIRKSLGYAYVWGDKLERAERLLEEIDEAKSEMKVYTWWWKEHDRSDLSSQASELVKILDAAP
jgi:O-antigen ligase